MKKDNEVAIVPGLRKGSFKLADVIEEEPPVIEAEKPRKLIPYKDPGLPLQRSSWFEVELRPDCESPECRGQHSGAVLAIGIGKVVLDETYLCWGCGHKHLAPCLEYDLKNGEVSREEYLAGVLERGIVRPVTEVRTLASGRIVDILGCGHAYGHVPVADYFVHGSLGARRCVKCEIGARPEVPPPAPAVRADPLRRPAGMVRVVAV